MSNHQPESTVELKFPSSAMVAPWVPAPLISYVIQTGMGKNSTQRNNPIMINML